jgi:hypothetical protein
MAPAMFLIVAGSGLRGRRTLEEGGPDVAVRCNNVVLTWLIRDGSIDQLDEEEDWDQEEESGGVMVRCVWEDKDQDSDEGCEEGESLPSADFWSAGHRWVIAGLSVPRRSDCDDDIRIFRQLLYRNQTDPTCQLRSVLGMRGRLVKCSQRFSENDLVNLLKSIRKSVVIPCGEGKDKLLVPSELRWPDGRSTNNDLVFFDFIPLCAREHHDRDVLARVRFRPKRISDGELGTMFFDHIVARIRAAPVADKDRKAFPTIRQAKCETVTLVRVHHGLRQLRLVWRPLADKPDDWLRRRSRHTLRLRLTRRCQANK